MSVLRVLNFKSSKKINLTPDEIDTLVNKKILDEWQAGDPDPYYKLEKIDYPILANGVNYKRSFFETYLSKLKERPIPGSKRGHEMMWGKRPPTDFIVIGGKIEGDGEKGSVYIKNYIPLETENGSNASFIKENKSDMVHYSIVAYVKEEREETPDGDVINVIESLYGERNDAVEYGTGAMKQITNQQYSEHVYNAQNIRTGSVANARKLIKSGDIDQSSSWSFTSADGNKLLGPEKDDWSNYALWHMIEDTDAEPETKARYKYPYGKNGKVYRSALRAIASRAGQQGLESLSNTASELIDLIDKSSNYKERDLTKEELIKSLQGLKANAVNLSDVAEAFGQTDQLITKEHVEGLKILNAFKELKIEDPVTAFKALQDKMKLNAESVRNAELDKAFGSDVEGKNILRQYAGKQCDGLDGEKLENKIKELKEEDPVSKSLAQQQADYTSETNTVKKVDNKTTEKDASLVGGVVKL